ncbi:unnamed protein product, partial [Gulo gulo]
CHIPYIHKVSHQYESSDAELVSCPYTVKAVLHSLHS